jgi:outer membrane lipoprotein-sorting protein
MKSASNANGNTANSNAAETANDTSTTPPFATKEPERYQATMSLTGNLGGQAQSIPGLSNLTNRQMFIARDGDRRRVDYELIPGMKMSYLQLGTERYVLLPSRKMYAELKLDRKDGAADPTKSITSDFSPERLLNESRTGSRFEKLGTEEVNGRTTTKYRVTTTGKTGEAKGVTTETIIWVDESLGMPVKSETTAAGGQSGGSKFTMELRDIKLDVEAALFELPQDFKKVEYRDISAQMFSSLPNLLGGDRDESAGSTKKGKR